MKRYMAECMGTFFLAMAVNFTGDAMAVGLMFMAMLYLTRPISGGHLNPAVSVGMAMHGKISLLQLPLYMLAQIAGACLFFGLAYGVFGTMIPARVIPSDALIGAGMFELLLTLVLCSVALYVSIYRFKDTHMHGLVLGLTLVGLMTFPGIYNPALALGSILGNLVAGHGAMPGLNEIFIYVGIPLVAGLAAALKFKWCYELPGQQAHHNR